MKNKKIYTRFLLGIGYILITLLISGCQVRESGHSITFIDDEVIEYSSDFKVSNLIKSVDDYTQDDFKVSEDDSLITLPGGKTIAVNVTNKEIKLDTIRFDFRYMNETYTKVIIIQDTTAPQIDCKDVYEVKKGNEYFDLINLITCKDNFTLGEEIEIYFNGSYDVNEAGDYSVQILAYDQKKNKAEKTVKITVKEDEPIVVEKPVDKENDSTGATADNNSSSNNHNNSSSNNSKPVSNSNTNTNKGNASNDNKNQSSSSGNAAQDKKPSGESGTSQSNNYTPQSRTFTIDNYDTFDDCFNACQSYINECMNKGYQGRATAEPIKSDDVYIGYRAVFN